MATATIEQLRDATNDTAGPGPCDASPRIDQIALALAKAQANIKSAEKDRTNPHFGSTYSTLASVQEACRAHLTANEIAVVQPVSVESAGDAVLVTVRTVLMHSSGQWLGMGVTFEARDAGPQAVGSCITYGRRYGLCAMAGVAPDDDDGQAGQGSEPRAGRPRGNDSGPKPMPNKFAGECYSCGGHVGELAGVAVKQGSAWVVKHSTDAACRAPVDKPGHAEIPAGCAWSTTEATCEHCGSDVQRGAGFTSSRTGKTMHPACLTAALAERVATK